MMSAAQPMKKTAMPFHSLANSLPISKKITHRVLSAVMGGLCEGYDSRPPFTTASNEVSRQHDISQMNVIVQKMIPAEISGVYLRPTRERRSTYSPYLLRARNRRSSRQCTADVMNSRSIKN